MVDIEVDVDIEVGVELEVDAEVEIEIQPVVEVDFVVAGSQNNIKAVCQDMSIMTVNNDISTLSYVNPEPIELEVENQKDTDGYHLEVTNGAQVVEPLTGECKKDDNKCCSTQFSHTCLAVVMWIVSAALMFIGCVAGLIGVSIIRKEQEYFFSIRIILYCCVFFFFGSFISAIVFTWKCCAAKVYNNNRNVIDYDIEVELEVSSSKNI